jgi:aspartate dehydrogenase
MSDTGLTPDRVRVGLIGHGAIGRVVARALRNGEVAGCVLGGVLDATDLMIDEQVADFEHLLAVSDVVVEAAGHGALATYGPAIRRSGKDLYVVSVGALVDDGLREQLFAAGRGKVILCSGAVGGFDVLQAAHRLTPLDEVSITTTKPPAALAEPSWMTAELLAKLEHAEGPFTVFEGTAREAAARFPRSVNVCATVALATLGLDRTTVRVRADPGATGVEHMIRASGPAGRYQFTFANVASPDNPSTSAITPHALLRSLADRRAVVVVG